MATFITLTKAFEGSNKVAIKVKTIITMEADWQYNEHRNADSGKKHYTKLVFEGGDKKYGISVVESIEQIQAEILLQKQLKKKQK